MSEPNTQNIVSKFRALILIAMTLLFGIYCLSHRLEPVCFDDCLGYAPLMGKSFFSHAYWSEWHGMFRAFSIPFIYSLFGSLSLGSAKLIVACQILLSFVAWLVFTWTLQSLTTSKRLRWLLAAVTLPMMFGRGYFHFNQYLLSDSLALSFLLLWFSLVIRVESVREGLIKRSRIFNWGFFAGFAAFTLLVSFTRDANLFLIALSVLLVLRTVERRAWKFALGISLIMISVAAFHASASKNRGRWSMFSAIGHHILTEPDRTAYFTARGMPGGADVMRFKNGDFSTPGIQAVLGPFVWKNGRTVYAEYLLTHPVSVLSSALASSGIIFNQTFSPSPPGPEHPVLESGLPRVVDFPRWPENLSPLDHLPVGILCALTVVALIGLIFRRAAWGPLPSIGLFFMTAGGSNALLAFFADGFAVNETERHCFIGSILLRIGCGILLATGFHEWVVKAAITFRDRQIY